jgi:hypothetical protein
MEVEYQRDEWNGNVWPWRPFKDIFKPVQDAFEQSPRLEEVTLTYTNCEIRFRRKGNGVEA